MQNRYTKTTPAKDISLFMKSAEERRVCFRMRQQGHSLQAIADAIGVSRRTITRWQTQGVQPPTRPKQRPALRKLSTELDAAILTYFTDNNTTTLRQAVSWLSSTHGISVSIHTVSRCCKRLGLTWKKGSKVYTEMSYSRANKFLQEIAVGFGPHVIALDEAAFFWNHSRGYAWSVRGAKAVIKRPGIRGRAHSLLLCISSNGVVQWQLYEGAVNAVRFSEFLARLPKHSKLVLDNAVIHRAANILAKQGLPTVPEVAQSQQITLAYLPPYAPILNPVELCFNTIRTYINRECPRSRQELVMHIHDAVSTLSQNVCDMTIRKVWNL